MGKKEQDILEGQILYVCDGCGQTAWGNEKAYLLCGYCHQNSHYEPMNSFWDEEFEYWTTDELASLALVHGG